MITFPNAKINLGLSITEKRPDGYHNLETVFYPVALEDALEIRTCPQADNKFSLHQYGMEISGNSDTGNVKYVTNPTMKQAVKAINTAMGRCIRNLIIIVLC